MIPKVTTGATPPTLYKLVCLRQACLLGIPHTSRGWQVGIRIQAVCSPLQSIGKNILHVKIIAFIDPRELYHLVRKLKDG